MYKLLRQIGFWIVFLSFLPVLKAQEIHKDSVVRSAPISAEIEGNRAEFSADMPPLIQISGAPKAFYTYYWEFGDGTYSFDEQPKHTYQKKGTYEVKLWSTNNYDNGKPPASRPKSVSIKENATDSMDNSTASLIPDDEILSVKTNQDPLPEEELVLITSYKNDKDYVTDGTLYLFFNDREFKDDNFKLTDTRMHHGEEITEDTPDFATEWDYNASRYHLADGREKAVPSTPLLPQDMQPVAIPYVLEESEGLYRNQQQIRFENMNPGEERHVFRTLKTTPEMLKDTSAIVTLRTIYIPDKNYGDHSVKDTEMEIVTSHDPNKMASNGTFMSYRNVRNKKIMFKIRFQNDGEGEASTIRLETDTPDLFDKGSLEILETYPETSICPDGKETNHSCLDTLAQDDKLIFTFKNVYLPGTAQKNVKDRDSTKGFVKYALKFKEDAPKQKTRSRTAIYFDKNEPVYTNYSTTRFSPGLSLGVKAGYIHTPAYDDGREVFAGVTLSPYKSFRDYWQAEFYLAAASFEDLKEYEESETNSIGVETLQEFTERNKTRNITAYLVPASYRYNLTDFLSVGAGVQLQLDLWNDVNTHVRGETSLINSGKPPHRLPERNTEQTKDCTHYFTNFNGGVFADVNVGNVRIGPSLGFRYVYNIKEPTAQLQAYAFWKF